jgi:hypothetical protein
MFFYYFFRKDLLKKQFKLLILLMVFFIQNSFGSETVPTASASGSIDRRSPAETVERLERRAPVGTEASMTEIFTTTERSEPKTSFSHPTSMNAIIDDFIDLGILKKKTHEEIAHLRKMLAQIPSECSCINRETRKLKEDEYIKDFKEKHPDKTKSLNLGFFGSGGCFAEFIFINRLIKEGYSFSYILFVDDSYGGSRDIDSGGMHPNKIPAIKQILRDWFLALDMDVQINFTANLTCENQFEELPVPTKTGAARDDIDPYFKNLSTPNLMKGYINGMFCGDLAARAQAELERRTQKDSSDHTSHKVHPKQISFPPLDGIAAFDVLRTVTSTTSFKSLQKSLAKNAPQYLLFTPGS